jgi:hypothetical protein
MGSFSILGGIMPGRGPQTFKKRQKEQERRERQQEKMAKRLQRKADRAAGVLSEDNDDSGSDTPQPPNDSAVNQSQ